MLGTHPMFGPDSAKGGVQGLPLIMCPARITAKETEQWRAFFSSLGLSVSIMSPDDHDREAAFTQGVAHYVGRVLSDFGVRRSPVGTVGFNKLLEIVEQTCNDPWQLFLDLQRYNPYTKEMRARLSNSLASVMSAIDDSVAQPPTQIRRRQNDAVRRRQNDAGHVVALTYLPGRRYPDYQAQQLREWRATWPKSGSRISTSTR